MKVLIVGSGGREHAIATSVAKSSKVEKIYCAPGNAGIAALAECVEIQAMDFERLIAFAKEAQIDLCIVGMDDPLVGGLVDEMEAAGMKVTTPDKEAFRQATESLYSNSSTTGGVDFESLRTELYKQMGIA